nr:trichohyalin-like [Aegilops tauschii subsp. strangulata]
MAGRLKVFYCVPILTPSTNGLRELSDDEQTDRMMMFVDIGHDFFSIYLDHDESFQANPDEDDVVYNPRAHLPLVFIPAKRVPSSSAHTEKVQADAKHEEAGADAEHEEAGADAEPETGAPIPLQVIFPNGDADEDVNQFEFVRRPSTQQGLGNQMEEAEPVVVQQPSHHKDNEMQAEPVVGSTSMRRSTRQTKINYAMEEDDAASDTDDEDYDPGLIIDSDSEIGNDDDDLYADNVDEDEPEQKQENKSNDRGKQKGNQVQTKAQDKGKQKYNLDEDLSEGEDFWAPDSYDEELHLKFKTFRPEDLRRPKFLVGQVFESVELLRTAIIEYSCQNRVDIKLPVNDRKRLKAKCDDECTCYLWASYDNRTKAFMNFQQSFKGDILKNQLWKIARSNTVQLYEQSMHEMKILNEDAHNWLHELEPETWVKAFQSDLPKCDILLKNNCERRATAEKKEEEKRVQREATAAKREEEKRIAAAKREEEKKLAAAKREEEKKLAATKREEEKILAAAKREEEKKLAAAKKEANKRLAAAQERMKAAAQKAREQTMAAAKIKSSCLDNQSDLPKKAPRSSMFDIFR